MQTSSKKFFHCILTGIVCILYLCSLPVNSFAGYTSNQLGSTSAELNFYKIRDFYNSNVSVYTTNYKNYGYACDPFEYLAISPNSYYTYQLWGIGDNINDCFDDYVYIYYPGCLTMLNINSDIVTYSIVYDYYTLNGYKYTTIGFSWYSSSGYSFNDMINSMGVNHGSTSDPNYYYDSTFNGSTRRIHSSAILRPGIVYDYNNSCWVSGYGSGDSSTPVVPYGPRESSLRAYDSLLGHFHYIDIFTIRSATYFDMSYMFKNYINKDYSNNNNYVSVFCPGVDIDSSQLDIKSDEVDSNNSGYFEWIFNNNNLSFFNPAEYVSNIISNGSGGSITTSEIKNNTGTTVPTTNSPYTTKPQTRPNMTTSSAGGGSGPGGGGSSESSSSEESSSDDSSGDSSEVVSALDDVVSGIDNLTGTISNTDVSSYIPSSSDSYGDLLSNVDEAVGALSSRGNDLSSVCGQAEVFVDDVFGALPSLVIAAISCAAIILFVCKVVNR